MRLRRTLLALASLYALSPQPIRAQRTDTVLRILAYNIRHGAGMDDSVDLARAATVINRISPDLVALQEIDSATQRTGRVNQASRLGELTNMHAVFGGFMEYQGGKYGMALLSRYPIVEITNHRLPDGREPRTALALAVRVSDTTEIVFVGIHLYASEEERLAQAHRLTEIFEHDERPVVLAGDFNSQPGTAVLRHLSQEWVVPPKGEDHLTFPSDAPDREIDYIMMRPAASFEVLDVRVIDEPLVSDHRPVLMIARMVSQEN